jgi:hypothetical protein
MEQSAIIAMQQAKEIKDKRLLEHKTLHAGERSCRGLNEQEWFKVSVKQKSTFSKSRKFSHTRLWNYKNVNPLNY